MMSPPIWAKKNNFTIQKEVGRKRAGGVRYCAPETSTREFFGFFLFMYYIQHCFICRPSGSTVSEDAGIEPRTVATMALAVRRSNHLARSHTPETFTTYILCNLVNASQECYDIRFLKADYTLKICNVKMKNFYLQSKPVNLLDARTRIEVCGVEISFSILVNIELWRRGRGGGPPWWQFRWFGIFFLLIFSGKVEKNVFTWKRSHIWDHGFWQQFFWSGKFISFYRRTMLLAGTVSHFFVVCSFIHNTSHYLTNLFLESLMSVFGT